MPSTYTSSLRLTLPATGELSGTWGTTVNTGITELTDAAIAGYVSIAMTDADYTLTVANGLADQARRMMLNMTGTLTGARNVICPTASKLYVIKNATTGGFAITLKTSGGSGISIPNGSSMLLMCDGTNVVDAVTQFSNGTFTNLAYTGTLTGGTGIVNLGSGQFYKDASGNVGIGTSSPVSKLDVVQASGDGGLQYRSSTRTVGLGQVSSEASVYWGSGTALTFFSAVERMRLDSSGNLGLGVTPSAWSSGSTAFQNSAGSIWRFGTNNIYFGQNYYWNGTSRIYSTTNAATEYEQGVGSHKWYTAPSGTAGNAISFTQAMTLDASGNLSVGQTTSASATLSQTTTKTVFSITPSNSNAGGTTITNSWVAGGQGPLIFADASTERMRLDSAGNLGIGTSSPAYKLDVSVGTNTIAQQWQGAGTGFNLRLKSGNGATPSSSMYRLYMDYLNGTNTNGYLDFYRGAAGNDGYLVFGTAGADRLTLDSFGNLGLGVTPSAWTGSGATVLELGSKGCSILGSASVTDITYNAYYDSAWKYGINGFASYYAQTGGTHQFFTAPSGTAGNAISFTQAMTLDASGNLGVGKTSPAYKVDVNGAVQADDYRAQASQVFYSTGDEFRWRTTGSAERARITSGGDFVINGTATLNTNAKLSVWNGSALGAASGIASGYSTTNGQFRLIYLNSNADALNFDNGNNNATLSSSGAWTNSSDARLKKNILPIKYGLETVLVTQPKSFNRVDVDGEYIGFIAQELQTQIPEVVYGDEDTKYSVDYGSLVAVAFKAIQEQQALITDLRARVAALEA